MSEQTQAHGEQASSANPEDRIRTPQEDADRFGTVIIAAWCIGGALGAVFYFCGWM